MQGPTVTTMIETRRQLARLRAALDRLGAATEGTRTPDADKAFYDCFGPLEVLEREAIGGPVDSHVRISRREGTP
ncbi:MAG: hypothetical protein O7G84_13580 [Gammaproteobacteria bacterium]|nr:hypothetical protein [Gammaproteobacteria bacterium]